MYTTFFFQAEDGIRDYKVTGVQTCALPIYILQRKQADVHAKNFLDHPRLIVERHTRKLHVLKLRQQPRIVSRTNEPKVRSEERRVGKERGGRWEGERYESKEENWRGTT